jgi:hypothetical protein
MRIATHTYGRAVHSSSEAVGRFDAVAALALKLAVFIARLPK